MSHVAHIQKNKQLLDTRFEILRLIREYFWSQNFIEVETPLLLRLSGQEPYLSPMKLSLHDETGKAYTGFLHTSPEYTMKKMLAAGYTRIFSLTKTFRDYESFGGTHNPEFTMIEWYREGTSVVDLMDDVEGLWKYVQTRRRLQTTDDRLQIVDRRLSTVVRITMRDLWKEKIGVDLNEYLDNESMLTLCKERGYTPSENESYEDLFYRIFLNEIEPKLAVMGLVCVYQYPAQMAALSALSKEDPRYAERMEVYVNGVELANGFYELRDKEEQKKRLLEEQKRRQETGKDVFDLDEEFLDAVVQMPSCVGIALGVDRLVMALTGCQNIDDVLPLPMSKLMNN